MEPVVVVGRSKGKRAGAPDSLVLAAGEGFIAFIPADTTVLLDVNTSVLASLVLEGNLLFDDSQPNVEIRLNTFQILVKGGNLSIGSNSSVYNGKARITL